MTSEIDFAIIMTSGLDTPKRLASPFFLAATAAAEDMKVVVYFTGLGTLLLKRGEAEGLYAKTGAKSSAFISCKSIDIAQATNCAPLLRAKFINSAIDLPPVFA